MTRVFGTLFGTNFEILENNIEKHLSAWETSWKDSRRKPQIGKKNRSARKKDRQKADRERAATIHCIRLMGNFAFHHSQLVHHIRSRLNSEEEHETIADLDLKQDVHTIGMTLSSVETTLDDLLEAVKFLERQMERTGALQAAANFRTPIHNRIKKRIQSIEAHCAGIDANIIDFIKKHRDPKNLPNDRDRVNNNILLHSLSDLETEISKLSEKKKFSIS